MSKGFFQHSSNRISPTLGVYRDLFSNEQPQAVTGNNPQGEQGSLWAALGVDENFSGVSQKYRILKQFDAAVLLADQFAGNTNSNARFLNNTAGFRAWHLTPDLANHPSQTGTPIGALTSIYGFDNNLFNLLGLVPSLFDRRMWIGFNQGGNQGQDLLDARMAPGDNSHYGNYGQSNPSPTRVGRSITHGMHPSMHSGSNPHIAPFTGDYERGWLYLINWRGSLIISPGEEIGIQFGAPFALISNQASSAKTWMHGYQYFSDNLEELIPFL